MRTFAACAAILFAAATANAAGPPNVVMLVADDLGWADTSLLGHKNLASTPNLDRLAARGVTFTRAYAAGPLCSPTRQSLMTGLHPGRVGMLDASGHVPQVVLQASREPAGPPRSKTTPIVSATRLKTEYLTLAESLKGAGYATGHFGKWHLGREPFAPLQQGFDVDFPQTFTAGPPRGYLHWRTKTARPSPAHEHIEDRTAKEAVDFIKANRLRPFFLNYWLFSVHGPYEAKPTLVQKYKRVAARRGSAQSPTYAAMIESMDSAVGHILDTLDRLKLSENTIIVFLSDNGGNVHSRVDGVPPANNGPLRGGKGTLWEGGIRVPCVVAWPGQTAGGTFESHVIQSTDFYPTILEMLSLPPQPGQAFDGISIVPALQGKPLAREAIVTYLPRRGSDGSPPGVAVTAGDWKLVRFFYDGPRGAHRFELYNLREDVRESVDLANQQPGRVAALDALIEQFLTGAAAVVPAPNPLYGFDL
ncbi:MAG TPA: sulfatase [Pirellulaceae bacterium]|nr:sulfatase [Pirellulaceae bacterium]